MKASIILLWLLVLLVFGAAGYLYMRVEQLEEQVAMCRDNNAGMTAMLSELESDLARLGGAHDELVKYIDKQAELEKQRADAEMGMSLLGLLFGL